MRPMFLMMFFIDVVFCGWVAVDDDDDVAGTTTAWRPLRLSRERQRYRGLFVVVDELSGEVEEEVVVVVVDPVSVCGDF